eukprot:jgi/Botrbrau1/15736/Bobra.4_1s0104.1
MGKPEPEPEAGAAFLEYIISAHDENLDLNKAASFDTTALHAIYDIEAFEGRLVCKLPVTELVQNRFGTLHGGCIGGRALFCVSHWCGQRAATLVDVVTSAALVTLVRRPSVSLTMSIDYLNPAELGTVVEIEGRVVKHGKSIAVTECDIRRADGTIVAQGKHTKFFKEGPVFVPKQPPPTQLSKL